MMLTLYHYIFAVALQLYVVNPAKVVKMDVRRTSVQHERVPHKLTERDPPWKSLKIHYRYSPENVIPVSLENKKYYYQISLEIGTPPQLVDFTLDTGSSDLWVMKSTNPYCNSTGTLPTNSTVIDCSDLVFDPRLSSTFVDSKEPFQIAYGDWTEANGTLATDVLRIGDNPNIRTLYNTTFGVADSANSTNCVFGIGFPQNEAISKIHKNSSGLYPYYFNVPTQMKQQGIIRSNAYSLYLNSKYSDEGSILFGGVDHSKYDGDLAVMPMYNYYHKYTDQPTQMRVMLNAIRTLSTGQIEAPVARFDIAVLLDSGTSYAYFPSSIVDAVAARYNYTFDDTVGYYYGPCRYGNDTVGSLVLDFSGAKILVPADDLLVELYLDDASSPLILDGEPICILALGSSSDPYGYILGDVFLRSLYAVYDLDSYQIGLAQAKQESLNISDIEEIIGTIPGGTLVPGYTKTYTTNSAIVTYPVLGYVLATTPTGVYQNTSVSSRA